MNSEAVNIPAHVPQERVFDVDFYRLDCGDDDVQLAWRRLQQQAPDIFWTPRNGGHWVATRADDIKTMQMDHEHFSHAQFIIPWTHSPIPALPLQLDPPDHGAFRALINPALSPKALVSLEEKARAVAIELIEALAPRGECEFVGDFAKVLPIVVFLGIVDLPAADREMLLPWADDIVRGQSVEARMAAQKNIYRYLQDKIAQRSREPGDDLISRITQAKVDDRPLDDAQVLGLCSLVLVGGLDTVASMLGFIARFLAMNHGHRQQLIEDPALITLATEELFRRHGLANTARLLTQDYEYKGVQFRKGDQVQLPNCLYGLDERMVDDPLTVDFHRKAPVPHATFGNGPHRCPGANLARREVRIFLEEWLKRIPDFSIKPGTKPVMASGMVNGMLRLELCWDV